MKRCLITAGIVTGVLLAGCKDSAAPNGDGPYVAAITDVNVPSQVALWDTVRLSFSYFTPGCDSSTVKIQQGGDAAAIHRDWLSDESVLRVRSRRHPPVLLLRLSSARRTAVDHLHRADGR